MTTLTKNIGIAIICCLIVGYLIGAVVWLDRHPSENVCHSLVIDITDQDERQYVDQQELVQLLRQRDLSPIGKDYHAIHTHSIEQAIAEHPMVRRAECYLSNEAEAIIRVEQRQPILRVIAGNDSYFVDSDRERMPIRESVTAQVPIAIGNIGQRMACNELADLALWLGKNKYWAEKIRRINVHHSKHIDLIQSPDGTRIMIGDLSHYPEQLERLQTLYQKGFDQIGWQTYAEIDLRFDGQVVCRKQNNLKP